VSPALAVVGSCGGAGGSLVAAGLALAAARDGRPVLLVDLDGIRGDQAGMLGTPVRRSAADLVAVGDDLDAAHLRAAAYPHPSGIAVVAAATEIDAAPADLVGRLAALPERPRLVLDLGSGSGAAARTASRHARVVVVAPLDAPGVRVTGRTLADVTRRAGGDVVVVANAGARRADISARALSRALGVPVATVLPRSDREALGIAVGALAEGRRAALATALAALADAVGLTGARAREAA